MRMRGSRTSSLRRRDHVSTRIGASGERRWLLLWQGPSVSAAEPRGGFAQRGGQIDCRVVAGGQSGGFASRGGYVVSSGRRGTHRDDGVR